MRIPSLLPALTGMITLISAACVDNIPLENRPCPCATGWKCCSNQLCIPEEESCFALFPDSSNGTGDGPVIATDGGIPDPDACVPTGPEVCGDSIDNDCNNQIDENCGVVCGGPPLADVQNPKVNASGDWQVILPKTLTYTDLTMASPPSKVAAATIDE